MGDCSIKQEQNDNIIYIIKIYLLIKTRGERIKGRLVRVIREEDRVRRVRVRE